jgi:hypothetical protein
MSSKPSPSLVPASSPSSNIGRIAEFAADLAALETHERVERFITLLRKGRLPLDTSPGAIQDALALPGRRLAPYMRLMD